MRKISWVPLCLTALIWIPAVLGACTHSDSASIPGDHVVSGVADQEGSFGQISEELPKVAGWQQYVHDSEFQLGEKDYEAYGKKHVGASLKYGTYPNIDGSTVAISMAAEFARQHLGIADEDIASFVNLSTTHEAYINLIASEPVETSRFVEGYNAHLDPDAPVDLFIGTEPSEEELALAKSNHVELIKKPVCYDAFVFITHKDNPVNSLTLGQIQKIYTGAITNWKEVGGEDQEIVAYQREKNSGSQTAMEKLVMKGKSILPPPKVQMEADMSSLIESVAEYQNGKSSLGYTYRFYIDTLYKNANIKVLKIDGVAPDPAQLRSGKYKLACHYYGVIRSADQHKTGGKFLDWMLTDEGQKCIAQAGYIPMR